MNKIRVFKGNELLYTFQSSVVPPTGSYLWIDESVLYYAVKDVVYNFNTKTNEMNVDLIVN